MRHRAILLLAAVPLCCARSGSSAAVPTCAAAVSATPAARPLVEEGASLEAAVLVTAASEREGIAWENDWIFRHYGRFRKKSVALASREGRKYDVITVELADHTEKVLYFDITEFFGK